MAKVKGPLFSVEGTGLLGDGICFMRSMGGARVIMNPTHGDKNSALQSVQRTSFLAAKSAWKALSAGSKAYYNQQAAGLKMTGYNLYIKGVLTGEISLPGWVYDSYEGQVATGFDDCGVGYYTGAWAFDRSNPTIEIGNSNANSLKKGGGCRFLNINIPSGATILTAHMHLQYSGAYTSPLCYARICGNKEVNPANWTNLADYQARRGTDVGGGDNTKRTTADVQWHLDTTMVVDTWYETPDITTVIQELIDQAGYTSNNPMVLFVDDHKNESSTDNPHSFYGYFYNPVKAAKLHITYKYWA